MTSSSHVIDKKRYLRFPLPKRPAGTARRIWGHLKGAIATPPVLFVSWAMGGPGIGTRLRCAQFGLRAIRAGHRRLGASLFLNPMDSFRYFEVSFAQGATSDLKLASYLDVSSPRLVPLSIVDNHPGLIADLINPIGSDLADTAHLAEAIGLQQRCRLAAQLLEDTRFLNESFDLITSVSVVEHIPDDAAAVAKMWQLLRPGGTLLLTVPCAAEACEEYANLDEYQLFDSSEDGFVYWQRYYDRAALEKRVWSSTGSPQTIRIIGEKLPGSYDRNVVRKRTGGDYPYWYEPLMMAREYREFEAIEQLPGMGVIAMTFVKPTEPPR